MNSRHEIQRAKSGPPQNHFKRHFPVGLCAPIALAITCAICVAEERAAVPEGINIYVSPKGSPNAEGGAKSPVDSLEAARELARAARLRAPEKAVTVWIGGGDYFQGESFQLTSADSGTADAPVTYRAMEGKPPRIIGARKLAAKDFKPVTDAAVLARMDEAARSHVLELDLSVAGIHTIERYPDMFVGSGGLFQLFSRGKRMPMAQWPDQGYTTIQEVLDSGLAPSPHGGTFVYRGNRPNKWQAALAEHELWVAGFWRVPWVVQAVRVDQIDLEKSTITLGGAVERGIGSKYTKEINGTRKGNGKENYYAFNLIEELDRPGEWCYRFANKTLYFWPPAPIEDSEIFVADSQAPTIRLKDAIHVVLAGLQVEGSLSAAIEIAGGQSNRIAGCTITNTGGEGVVITGGTDNGVQSCEFSQIGAGGILLDGGERKSLTPAGHFADNNHIHHIGSVTKIVNAITVKGVGNRVTHNLIHDTPNSGILYGGNEHIFEFNELHNIGLDSGDLGAFYTVADWTSRGNIVRNNFIHHSPAANSVYLDDGHCGDEVTGNVCYRVACGPFVSGGGDNRILHNLVVDARVGIHIDDRGVARHYNAANRSYLNKLNSVDYMNPPWSNKYPSLVNILKENTELPNRTSIKGNVLVRCQKPINLVMNPAALEVIVLKGNLECSAGPGLADMGKLDFTLLSSSEIFAKIPEFKPIPFAQIGLYTDQFRRQVAPRGSNGGNEERQRSEIFNSETDMKRSNEIEGKPKP